MGKKILAPLMAASAVIVVSTGALAEVEVQSMDFDFPLSPGSAELEFDQFDTMGGIRELKSVELVLTGGIGAAITAENQSTLSAPDFSVAITGMLSVDFATLSDMLLLDEVYATGGLAPSDGVMGSGPDFYDFGTITAEGSDSMEEFVDLAPYIGGGTLTAFVEGSGGFVFFGSTDVTFTIDDFMAFGTVELRYTYNLIPAPGALALLGFGMVGMNRRRRR